MPRLTTALAFAAVTLVVPAGRGGVVMAQTQPIPYDAPPPTEEPEPSPPPRTLLTVPPARPPEPPLVQPASVSTAGEGAIMAAQLVVGTLAMAATGGAVLFLVLRAPQLAIPLLLVSPVIGGATVCGIGNGGDRYHGGCGTAIGLAYLAAVLVVPLAAAAGSAGGNTGALVGAAAGFTVGTTLAAIGGWRLGRTANRPPELAILPGDRLIPADPFEPLRRRPAAEGWHPSLPLLALRF